MTPSARTSPSRLRAPWQPCLATHPALRMLPKHPKHITSTQAVAHGHSSTGSSARRRARSPFPTCAVEHPGKGSARLGATGAAPAQPTCVLEATRCQRRRPASLRTEESGAAAEGCAKNS